MDVSYPAKAEPFRSEVRTVPAEELPPGWAGIGAIAAAGPIYAGASEVRRNILAETVLGLPKERHDHA